MKALALLLAGAMIAATPLAAQVGGPRISSPTIMAFSSCLDSAIKESGIAKSGESLVFTCSGDSAKRFYDYLGALSVPTASEDIPRRGVYRTRYFRDQHDGNQCYLQVEDAAGTSVSIYGCTLVYAVGPLINR